MQNINAHRTEMELSNTGPLKTCQDSHAMINQTKTKFEVYAKKHMSMSARPVKQDAGESPFEACKII